jgi:hypothetical protein
VCRWERTFGVGSCWTGWGSNRRALATLNWLHSGEWAEAFCSEAETWAQTWPCAQGTWTWSRYSLLSLLITVAGTDSHTQARGVWEGLVVKGGRLCGEMRPRGSMACGTSALVRRAVVMISRLRVALGERTAAP